VDITSFRLLKFKTKGHPVRYDDKNMAYNAYSSLRLPINYYIGMDFLEEGWKLSWAF
jgi:hypothetical protein